MYLKNKSLNFYPLRRDGPYLLNQNVTLSFKLCNLLDSPTEKKFVQVTTSQINNLNIINYCKIKT